jgi:hypothetical protein
MSGDLLRPSVILILVAGSGFGADDAAT